MPLEEGLLIDRAALARVFHDPRTLIAFESIQQAVQQDFPSAINANQQTADDALAAAAAAQSTSDTIALAEFVVTALSGALTNERLLQGGVGVTIDTATPSAVRVLVNALTILNAAAITLTQPVDVNNDLKCNTLEIDVAATASATASDHSVPIKVGGVQYYMRLSTAP